MKAEAKTKNGSGYQKEEKKDNHRGGPIGAGYPEAVAALFEFLEEPGREEPIAPLVPGNLVVVVEPVAAVESEVEVAERFE